MPILTANSCNATYTVTTTDNNVTIKITNITKSGTFSQKTNRTVSLKLGGTTLLTRTARKPPTRTQIASTKDHKGKITATMMTSILSEEKTSESANIDKAWTDFLSDFNAKKNTSALTVTYTRGTEDKQHNLAFSVFGITASVTLVVARKSEGSTPVTHDVNKTIGIENVNNGKNYVINAAAYAKYGHIERVVDFSDVKDEKQLLSLATTYVNSMQFDDMSLSLSAVDLHNLTGSVPAFQLLDEVHCISDPHGLDRTFPITEVTIPLDDPSGVQYTLGKTGVSSMSQSTASNAADLFKRFNKMPGANRILDTAKIEMSTILNNRTTGYVNIVHQETDGNDISQALVISNRSDWTQATKLWKFDMNGLGFSDSTVGDLGRYDNATTINADDRLYKIGMTMDGTIVADFIKTGLLEDGLGYNYWNLSTGEFRLSQNTLLDTEGLDSAISSLGDLTNELASTNNTIDEVYGKEVGSSNVLRKSDDFSILNASGKTWSSGGWQTYVSNTSLCSVQIVHSFNNGFNAMYPAPDLNRAVKFVHGNSTSSPSRYSTISQQSIKLASNTTYTLACYACGVQTLTMSVSGNSNLYYSKALDHNDWKRYNFVFRTLPNGSVVTVLKQHKQSEINTLTQTKNTAYNEYQQAISDKKSASFIKTKKQAYSTAIKNLKTAQRELELLNISVPLKSDNTVNVSFGHKGTGSLVVSGLTLVKGNISSEWKSSDSDLIDYTESLNDKLSVEYLMDKLTQNGKKQGVYFKGGQLLINAAYIMTGLLSDKTKKNKWNLDKGVLSTTNMIASNIQADGVIQSLRSYGSNIKYGVKITSGKMDFRYSYHGNNGSYGSLSVGRAGVVTLDAYDLVLSTKDRLKVTPLKKIIPKNVQGQGNKRITIKQLKPIETVSCVLNIKGLTYNSKKKIVRTTLAKLIFTHGLLTYVNTYDPKQNKLHVNYANGTYGYPVTTEKPNNWRLVYDM